MQPFDNHILQRDLTFFFMEKLRTTVSSLRDFQHYSKKFSKTHCCSWMRKREEKYRGGYSFYYGAKCCSSPRQRVIMRLERRQNSACQSRAAAEATEAAASKRTVHWILEKASKRCIGFRNSNTEERYNDQKSMFCVSMSADSCWYCSWPDAAASNNAHATTLFLKCSRFRVLSSQ